MKIKEIVVDEIPKSYGTNYAEKGERNDDSRRI